VVVVVVVDIVGVVDVADGGCANVISGDVVVLAGVLGISGCGVGG
jgi:hypothetical protein